MSKPVDFIKNEKEFLDKVHSTYRIDDAPQVQAMRDLIVRTFLPYIRGGRGLEFGCSDGYMTERLASCLDELDVVDGSSKFIEQAQKRNPDVNFIYSLFEEFKLREEQEKYDYAFVIYVLEHVSDPVQVLKVVRSVLKPDGTLFVIVPNARALSRQLAVHMGLLNGLKELTENDIAHGHRRVFDRVALNETLESSGFETISQGGIMLKILADFQMNRLMEEKVLEDEHIDGLYKLGLEYPDLCGSLFSVCTPRR